MVLTVTPYLAQCPQRCEQMTSKHGARFERDFISVKPLGHTIEGKRMRQTTTPWRRLTARIEVSEGVWVYWRCDGREDVLRVRNVSLGGLFVETPETRPVGIMASLDFLVQEGPIRADALVRHATATSGLGLKFLAVKEADQPRLASLVMRLRTLARLG